MQTRTMAGHITKTSRVGAVLVLVLGLVGLGLTGCETIYYEEVVYTGGGYGVPYDVVDEVIVETHFVVVDDYGYVLEEVEVTWESYAYYSTDCDCDDPAHYYSYGRRASGRLTSDTVGTAGELPMKGDEEVLFRFRKDGYADAWVSSADMEVVEHEGRRHYTHRVVLHKL